MESLWRGGCLALALHLPALSFCELGAAEGDAAPFSWRSTYAEALSAALDRKKPLLVYFPPIEAAQEPRFLALAQRALGTPPAAEGARIGSADIEDLVKRFGVKHVPALLLIDRRENVLLRWEERFPKEPWKDIDLMMRRLAKKEEEDARVLREGQALEEAGDLEGAYRKVLPLVESIRTAPDTLAPAKRIESRYAADVRRRMLAILGKEGLVPEAQLAAELDLLRGASAHAGTRREIEKETARLRETVPGARG